MSGGPAPSAGNPKKFSSQFSPAFLKAGQGVWGAGSPPHGVPGGRALQKAVLAQCPNVYLVLSGHRYNVAAVPVSFDDDGDGTADRTVYQMIANYQAAGSEGGSGYMRFLQIDEAAGELRAYSYSPYLEDYRYWDEPGTENEKSPVDPANEEITLPLPWA